MKLQGTVFTLVVICFLVQGGTQFIEQSGAVCAAASVATAFNALFVWPHRPPTASARRSALDEKENKPPLSEKIFTDVEKEKTADLSKPALGQEDILQIYRNIFSDRIQTSKNKLSRSLGFISVDDIFQGITKTVDLENHISNSPESALPLTLCVRKHAKLAQ